jgi:hypothetical protein
MVYIHDLSFVLTIPAYHSELSNAWEEIFQGEFRSADEDSFPGKTLRRV